MSLLRVGRWMSRAEYDAMVQAGRLLPTLRGEDMKHVTLPPSSQEFRSAPKGRVFAEFDIIDAYTSPGGKAGWLIVYGANSFLGQIALRGGLPHVELPRVLNVVITKTK